MKYEIDFGDDENLACWSCGDDSIDSAVLIEWTRKFVKEILCNSCHEELKRNNKHFKVLATIHRSL